MSLPVTHPQEQPAAARMARARAWLVDRLGAQPERFEPASEDASFRCYFRATVNGSTWIVMDAPPESEDSRPFLEVGRMLEAAGLAAPHIEAADLGLGLLQLEDMGRSCYLDLLDDRSADALYSEALGALVAMQSRVDASELPPYGEQLLNKELALFDEWFLARHLGIELDRRDREVLDRSFERLRTAYGEQPQVFVHRDYHSRNLMHRGADAHNPGIIDFQDAVRGPLTYDLVSLLRDVYIDWPLQRVEGWVGEYLARSRAAGSQHPVASQDIDEARLFRWFDLTGAQRHLKVAGLFCRLWHRDGKSRYLADIPLALDYLMHVCRTRPEMTALGEVLDRLQVCRRMRASLDAIDQSA